MVVKPSKSISIDAIEQFQVCLITFTLVGGAKVRLPRSGTNNFEGSAFFLNRDETLLRHLLL
jgi:hypothetical protein